VISSKIRNEVSTFVKKNPGSFERDAIYRVSQAAGPLAEFIKAMLLLAETYEAIRPLEEQMKVIEVSP
jgi:dynein heavy chain 2